MVSLRNSFLPLRKLLDIESVLFSSGVLQNQNPTDPFDSFRGLCHVRRGGRAQDEQSEGMQSRQVEGGRQPLAQELLLGLRGQEEGERP